MSRDALWRSVRLAWALLGRSDMREAPPGREREPRPLPRGDEPSIEKEGFVEDALPWLDAVYRFALRLTRGDRDAAEDLVQDTFLRAYRFWHTFERGTRMKSWLFTICRNTYLHERDRLRNRRERPVADFEMRADETAGGPAFERSAWNPERDFFRGLIHEEVVEAIDGLPDEFRDVLALSDLGDLRYKEIAEVLDIPVGTVKSRLFRARRLLQDRLRDYAVREGYVQEDPC